MTVRFLELLCYVLLFFFSFWTYLALSSGLPSFSYAYILYPVVLYGQYDTSNDFKCLTKTRHRIVIMLIQILKKAVVSLSFIMSHYGQTSFLRYFLFTIWFGFEYYNSSKISERVKISAIPTG